MQEGFHSTFGQSMDVPFEIVVLYASDTDTSHSMIRPFRMGGSSSQTASKLATVHGTCAKVANTHLTYTLVCVATDRKFARTACRKRIGTLTVCHVVRIRLL